MPAFLRYYCRPQSRLLVAVIAVWACGNPLSSAPTLQDPPDRPGKATGGAGPKVPADQSLTTDEYIRLGLPAPDRDWSGDDMVNVEKVLASLTQKGNRYLPRYRSKRSGEFFARLTSIRNLDQYKSRDVPFAARFPELLKSYQATNQVLKLYLAAFVKQEVGDSEIVELVAVLLRSTVVLLALVDELLPTLNKGDPSYQTRMDGLERMKRGLATMVGGGLQMLSERGAYRPAELARLVGYMQETFPVIVPRLPPGSRTEMVLRLEKMQKDPALKELQPGLQKLYAKVKSSLDKAKTP